jgi:hypothetical protein
MNEQVETIYTQMFAPNPIPQQVIDLFDRINFCCSRIDAPNAMRATQLAIIGGIGAFLAAKGEPLPPQMPKPTELIDTTEPPTRTTTQVAPPADTTSQNRAPTGPMDAPARPTNKPEVTAAALATMAPAELREHARQCFGVELNKHYGKALLLKQITALQKGG